MAKSLELIFKNEQGKTVRFSIPEPKEPTDPATVNATMDLMIAKNVFVEALTEKVAARITESSQSEIVLF